MARQEIEWNGQRYEIDAPEGASVKDIAAAAQRQLSAPPSEPNFFQRAISGREMTSGIEDIAVGATQLLERTIGKERFDNFNQWLETHLDPAHVKFLGGLADVPGQPNEDYDEYVTRRKQILNQRYGEGPNALRIAGNVAAFVPLGGEMLAAAPLRGAAALGGLAGLTEPVENAEEEGFLGTKIGQTLIGAGEGLGFGVAGKGVAAGINRAGKEIAKRFAIPDIQKIIDRGRLPTQASRTRAQNSLNDLVAKQTIGERMASDKKGGGLSQAQLLALVREANEQGIPMTMADFADPELKGLIGNLVRVPGPARTRLRKYLEDRDRREGEYLTKMVRRYLHALHPNGDDTAYRTGQALIAQQSKDAAPLYAEVSEHPGVMSDKLRVMLSTDALQKALRPGIEFETNMAAAEGKVFNPVELGLRADKEGNFAMPAAPQLRVLDIAKKGLDAMIGAERDAVTGRLSQRGLGLDTLRRAFLEEIDKLDKTGVYKRARDAWGGPAASLDALRIGRNIFKQRPEEFAEHMAGLSEENKDFVRVGAADSLIEQILKAGLHADEAKKIAGSQWVRMQLAPLFRNPADYEAFLKEVDYATRRFETKRVLMGGSQTAERVAEDTSAPITRMAVAAQVTRELAHGNPIRAVQHIFKYFRDVGFTPDEKLNDAIAKIVTTTDPVGAKRHAIPSRFNLKRLENPLATVSSDTQRILSQILTSAAAQNQPQ